MNRSVILVILVALFAFGFHNAKEMWLSQESRTEQSSIEEGIAVGQSSEYTSFISCLSKDALAHSRFDNSSTDQRLGSMFFLRNDYLGVGSFTNFFKVSWSICNVHTLSAFLVANEYKLSLPDNHSFRPTYRYYVYALRHILI